jgi:hypothetical protein
MEATRRYIPEGREAQYDLADQLGKCVQEIACDRYATLPQYRLFRTAYFDGERRDFYRAPNAYLQYQGDDADTPNLAAYLAVYRLIRAEAGLRLYEHDAGMRTTLHGLRQRYRDELRRACGSDQSLYEALEQGCDRIVDVRVDVNEPDECNYMELFNRVMSLQYP